MTDTERVVMNKFKNKQNLAITADMILDTMIDGLVIIDVNGNIIQCNSAYAKMHKFKTCEAMIGINLSELIVARDVQRVMNGVKKCSKVGTTINFEHTSKTKTGKEFPVLVNATVLKDKKRKIVRLVGVVRDITEFKKMEERLHKSRERHGYFVNITGQIGWVTNASGEIEADSYLLKKFTGQTYANIKGLGWMKAIHPDDLEHAIQAWNKAVRAKNNYEIEYRMRRHDGIYRYLLVRRFPLFRKDKSICEWIGTGIDITERKEMEDLLQANIKRYQSIYNASRDAIMILEPPSWMFTSGNLATIKMFRAKDEAEFTACEPWKLSPKLQPDGRLSSEKAKAMIETAMREGSNFFEWVHRRLNGEVFFAEVLLSRVNLSDQVFLQAMVRDITERKRLEAIKESELRFHGIVALSQDAIMVTDITGQIEYMNPATEIVFNCKAKNFIGTNFGLVVMNGKSTEIDIFRLGKDLGIGEMYMTETEWLHKKAFLIMIHDVTEQRNLLNKLQQSEKVLKRLAQQDFLTGLANRYQFMQIIDKNIAYAKRHKTTFAILLMDLDKFKEVNDIYGHDIGDLLLKEVAARLSVCMRKEDFVARLGGDEFIMLAIGIKTLADAKIIAQKILIAVDS